MDQVRIAVVGAGLIGRRHIQAIARAPGVQLHSLTDPDASAQALASDQGVACYGSLDAMLAAGKPDGVVLATPNQTHLLLGCQCAQAGLPMLIEKPLAVDVDAGQQLIDAAGDAGVALLVGHHRRYNPLIQKARNAIKANEIGRLISVHAMFWLFKPDDYFDQAWRRAPGAGPVFINLIHDIDLLHYLCGPIESVQAMLSSDQRGYQVEDSAVMTFRFASGALGTVNVSDTVVAPWSWELSARENPAYPATGNACYWLGGTHGSLELPGLRLWHQANKRSWWDPIDVKQLICDFDDPIDQQMVHFAQVIRGQAKPIVTGLDGLRALQTIDAINRSARSGRAEPVGVDASR